MEIYLREALEIVKAQASVRNMSEDAITSMLFKVAKSIRDISEDQCSCGEANDVSEPKKAVKEKSITCLECSKQFKILTKKHLLSHNMNADDYREKWGYKKGAPLVCKSLQRERRKKMKEMQLWKKRQK